MNPSTPITIIGAGPTGLALALYLAKRNFSVDVYERRKDPRQHGFSAGRSINLALSHRGIVTLKELGIFDQVKSLAIPMRGRSIHMPDSSLRFSPYGFRPEHSLYALSRGDLTLSLLKACELYDDKIRFFFDTNLIKVDLDQKKLQFVVAGERPLTKNYDVCISSDGGASTFRDEMTRHRTTQGEYQRFDLNHAYKELFIPQGSTLEREALHIWPRKSFMLIALPNFDGSFTCTLFLENATFNQLNNAQAIEEFFQREFPDAIPLMPTLVKDFQQNPTSTLYTIHYGPWYYKNSALLIGDAAHAIVPFYGQGMNCCFEDCHIFNQLMDQVKSFDELFQKFYSLRKADADAISEMALENFIEMRDKTADEHFLFQKKIEQFIAQNFQEKYLSQYHLVTFSSRPYSEAFKVGKSQRVLLEKLATNIEYAENKIPEVLKNPALQEFFTKG